LVVADEELDAALWSRWWMALRTTYARKIHRPWILHWPGSFSLHCGQRWWQKAQQL